MRICSLGGTVFFQVLLCTPLWTIIVGVRVILFGGMLKRFSPFSYLNHSFILSLHVEVSIRFIAFLQVSFCFFICQEFCWIRGLCISFTSSCFLFPVGGGSFRTGEVTDQGVSTLLHATRSTDNSTEFYLFILSHEKAHDNKEFSLKI